MKRLLNYCLFIGAWLLIIILAPSAHAQSVSLSVSPPVVEILLAPNKKVTQTFTLQTQGADLTITPELHLAHPSDDSGHVSVDPNPLSPATIPLTVTITGPSIAPTLTFEAASMDIPQDVYLALVFKANPAGSAEQLDSRASSTLPAISSLILVTIIPTASLPINLEIQNFSPPVIHDTWIPLTLTPTIVNHTPIMVRPEGKYEIIDPAGKTVFSLPFYPNLILGNSSRKILGDGPLPLSWSPTWSNIGPYRLRLTVTSQGGTKLTEVEKVIWLLPLRLGIITIILLIIIFSSLLTIIFKHSKFKPV